MAAVAGVAVALTVVVLAVAQYEAARSTLRGADRLGAARPRGAGA